MHKRNRRNIFTKRLFVLAAIIYIFCSCNKQAGSGNASTTVIADPPVSVTLVHTLPAILKESSGLCYTDGSLWTFGDSGNPNSLFKIDTSSGMILQTVTLQNFTNTDWEDITADSVYIYVGDFGNNDGNRKDLKILRIKKSDIDPAISQESINAQAINFSYADQHSFNANNNTNFDCEALISLGDNLYIFSKDGGDLKTRCYRLPKDTGTYLVSPIDSFNTAGKITSASYNPVTKELALGGYMNKKIFPFIWFFKNFSGDKFFSGASLRCQINKSNTVWQTEGLDYTSANRMFLSCESAGQTGAGLYSVKLNLSY